MQTQTAYQVNAKEGLLRNTLRGNAIFSVISGLLFTFAAGQVATFTGIPSTIVVLVIGISLLPFAIIVFRVATSSPLDKKGAKTIIGMDIAWVIASYVFLFVAWSMLTVGGRWFVALQGEAIFLFALFQSIGLRRIQ
ncbi:MAG: hypothetical protein DWQ04_22275 [Chloroflexi bacterium]|nr:MAG: hypothetical protein DWQ04_22275 [Chloroflexota bacterium]